MTSLPWTDFLLVAGVFLLSLSMHSRGAPSISRKSALRVPGISSRQRWLLERFWLLNNVASAMICLGFLGGLHLVGTGHQNLVVLCFFVAGIALLASVLLGSLPPYLVVKSWRDARDRANKAR